MFGPHGLFSGNHSASQETKEEVKDPKQAIKDDAKEDAKKIKEAFETKGSQEAWDLLKAERQNSKSLSAEDQDVWEKSVSEQIMKGQNKMLLPALSIAYINENKDALVNSNGYIAKEKVSNKQENIMRDLKMEKAFGKDIGTDDVDAMLLTGANETIKNDVLKPINIINEMQRGLFSHKQNSEEAIKASRLDDAMEMMNFMGKAEAGFIKNREFNKSIADRLATNDKMFNTLDESNNSFKSDGKITFDEVDRFLDRVKKSSTYKANFTADDIKLAEDLQKTLKDKNTYEDTHGTLVNVEKAFDPALTPLIFSGMLPIKHIPGVTKETVQKTHNTELPKADVENTVVNTTPEVKEEEQKKENKDSSGDETTPDKVTEKTEDKTHSDKTEEEKEKEIKVVDKYSGEYENQLVSDGTQKVGEGPWQVAQRLLKDKNDPAAQKALTEILKAQLVEGTQSKDYKEAVTKLTVGYNFLTCEGLAGLRQKAKESGNQTLIDLFGEPKMEEATKKVMYVWGKPVAFEA